MVSVGFAWLRLSQSNQAMEAWLQLSEKTSAGSSSDVRYQVASPSELKLLSRTADRVKELRIFGAERLTENDFSRLSAFGNLKTLSLHYDGVVQTIPTDFRHCPSLTCLHLSLIGQHISRENIRNISELDLLTSLDLTATNVTDADVAIMLEGSQLIGLRLGMTSVTDESAEILPPLAPSLELLELTETQVSAESLRFISQLTNLQELHLARLNLSIAEVRQLGNLRKLKCLSLSRETLSEDAIKTIQSLLPQCTVQ